MKNYQKYSAAAGIILFILAALFSVSLLSVALDFGGAAGNSRTIFYSLGKMFTGVYGFTAICVPVFLIAAGIQCFSAKWRVRNGVILLGSVIPFFTLDAIEHICRMIISSDSDSVMAVKLASTLLIGSLVLAAEYLLLSILGDILENSISENKEFFSNEIPQITNTENTEEELEEADEEEHFFDEDEPVPAAEKAVTDTVSLSPAEEKTDLTTNRIFLKQKEILKDLIDDDSAKEPETLTEEPEIFTSEPEDRIEETVFSTHEPELPNEEAELPDEEPELSDEDETIAEDPTIIELPAEESELTGESIAEEELLAESIPEEEFAEPAVISDDATVVADETPVTEDDEALIAEMNRIYGAEETETVSEETSEPVIHEVTKEDETIAEETPAFEEEPLAEEEVTFKEEPLAEEISESENFDDIEESEIPDFTADFGDEDEDIFGSWDSPSDGSEPQTEEVAAEEPEESEESFEEPFHDDNPADFINIEDIAESPSDEEGDSMGVDDIFSEMDADAAENPVFKAQPAPAAHDSLYQPETIAETETAVVPEEDEDSDEEDKILNQIDEINEINFDDEDFEEPDVVTEEEIAETEEESEIAENDEDSEKEKNGMRKLSEYKIPTDLLEKFENDEYWRIDEETKAAGENLKKTLNEFGIEAEVTGIRKGPVVTMFELLPAPGVKLSKIVNLQDNIALALAAKSVRIVAPIPGRHAVGIEIPNKERAVVSFREIIEQDLPEFKKMSVPVILGKDISGQSQIIDIAKTPHLLIAGATGAGKSVCVNSIILSILYNRSPKDVKLIMVDPKVVELKLYNDIPHLLTPVVTEPKRALQVLQYCICEMERRYALLDGMGVRDIVSYNTRIRERKIATEKLPYIVVIIDEFADLMATSGKELESNVARLTAMSRAVGIHLVLATQRPSVNVITGLIKANIPSRIAFMVASRQDSQIIIDSIGAEKLLGKGDMLYTSAVNPIPTRIQGTLVGDNEVERVVDYVKTFGGPDYIDDEIFVDDDEEEESEPGLFSDGEDPLYDQALQIVIQTGKASASYLQRRLKIGYNRAARLVEEMEERGIVGPANGSKPREIIHMP